MPIIVGVGSVAPPPPVVPPTPTPAEKLSATWTAPDGTVWPLTDRRQGYHTLPAVVAFGAPPVTLTADPNPRGGSTMRNRRFESRVITWPVIVSGKTHTEFIDRWRALGDAFVQTVELGPGTLTVARPDGTARQIDAFYQDGYTGLASSANDYGWTVDTAIMSLYCENGLWRDANQTVITRTFVGSPGSFFSPFLHLSSALTLGDTIVTNPGDVEAWPTWTLTGPCTGLTATRNDTGESFTLTITLGDGEQATITTDPPSVIDNSGDSAVADLNWPDAVLWSLPRGDTSVTFTVDGSDDGTTVELAFYPRYVTG